MLRMEYPRGIIKVPHLSTLFFFGAILVSFAPEEPMKDTFTRFLFYLFITIVITGIFRSSWPDPASTEPFTAKVAFYFTHYGIGWTFGALVLLFAHEAVRYIRRRKAIDAP